MVPAKTRPPGLAAGTVERPRVLAELDAAARDRQILVVVASAGSGKTTAVVQFVTERAGPVAWLTLSETDDRPGRFVAYLGAALERIRPGTREQISELLADGLSAEESAAALAEVVAPGATLVIDDLHHVEARAPVLRTLRAFLDALPPHALVVLISRRLVRIDLSRHALDGRLGAVSDEELTFRVDEIAALLAAQDRQADPEEVAAATGGWAAGVVFDTQRGSRAHSVLSPTEDPFFAYLGAEVMDALPPPLGAVVLRSGILEVVTPAGLRAVLGIQDADRIFASICRHHLPGTIEPDGLRYHPRFREFLRSRLGREHPDEIPELTARLARALVEDGQLEEAVDHLLAAGRIDEALSVMPGAVPLVMQRGDWDKVLSWCATTGDERLAAAAPLRGAQIRSLMMGRHQEEVVALVSAMRASGEYARLAAMAPDVAAWAVWALHGSGEWRELAELVPVGDDSRRAQVMRHILLVGTSEAPPPPLPDGELDRVQPLHVALESAFYYRGRFGDVERLAWAAAGRGPVTAALAEIYRIAALRARGELTEARAAFEATAPRIRASRFIEFWQAVEAELLFAEGDRERGLALLRTARQTSRSHLYRVADRAVFSSLEGKMLVRMGALPEAAELLGMTRRWCRERGLACFREWADTWLAAALLGLHDDARRPLELLRDAVEGMQRAERRLELPAACVFLAEAEWRGGNEAGHDAAADAAYAAAVECGSLTPLLDALEVMPDVLARRLDAAGPADDNWRALARTAREPALRVAPAGALLRVRTLGEPALERDGAPIPQTSAKAVELAAALARAGAAGVPRARLISELFDDSRDGANYLRQVIHRLRRRLPAELAVVSAGGRLSLLPAEVVVVDDEQLEWLLGRAGRAVGAERLELLTQALALARRGPYLAGVDGQGARHRREQLERLVNEATREYAQALLAAGRPGEAAFAARDLVRDEPYREDGWQLLMRAEAAAGNSSAAVPTFLECQRALAEVGLDPSPATRQLLDRLRAAAARVQQRTGQ